MSKKCPPGEVYNDALKGCIRDVPVMARIVTVIGALMIILGSLMGWFYISSVDTSEDVFVLGWDGVTAQSEVIIEGETVEAGETIQLPQEQANIHTFFWAMLIIFGVIIALAGISALKKGHIVIVVAFWVFFGFFSYVYLSVMEAASENTLNLSPAGGFYMMLFGGVLSLIGGFIKFTGKKVS